LKNRPTTLGTDYQSVQSGESRPSRNKTALKHKIVQEVNM